MSHHPRRRAAGFTFVEVLAALLFLAIVVPSIMGALSLSNRAAEITERGSVAGQLAQNKLNEMLIDKTWQNPPESSGDFGVAFPGYRWELTQPGWSGDTTGAMTALKMEVFFKVQGVEKSIALTTLVNSLASAQDVSALP